MHSAKADPKQPYPHQGSGLQRSAYAEAFPLVRQNDNIIIFIQHWAFFLHTFNAIHASNCVGMIHFFYLHQG